MTKADEKRLDTFLRKCLRRISKVHCNMRLSNDEIRRIAGIEKISSQVRRRRWKRISHVLRMTPNQNPHVALSWAQGGNRSRGRQVFVSTEPVSTIASKSDSFSKDIVQFSLDISLVDLLGFSFHGSFGSTFNQFPFGPADFCLDYVYRFTAYWNLVYTKPVNSAFRAR